MNFESTETNSRLVLVAETAHLECDNFLMSILDEQKSVGEEQNQQPFKKVLNTTLINAQGKKIIIIARY